MEQDLVEAQLAQQAAADNLPPTLSLSKKLKLAAKETTTGGCISSCCRLRNRRGQRSDGSSRSSSGCTGLNNPATITGGSQMGKQQQRQRHQPDWELNDIEELEPQLDHSSGRDQKPSRQPPAMSTKQAPQVSSHQSKQQPSKPLEKQAAARVSSATGAATLATTQRAAASTIGQQQQPVPAPTDDVSPSPAAGPSTKPDKPETSKKPEA